MQDIISRLSNKSRLASDLHKDLEKSITIKEAFPEVFDKGSFTMTVTAKHSVSTKSHLPYKAHLTYQCGTVIEIDFNQWVVLSRTYYPPDVLSTIKNHWVRGCANP